MSTNQTLTFGGQPFATNGCDLEVNLKNYPGVQLIGTEVGATISDQREISGATWTATNAYYVPGVGWEQLNAATSSTCVVQNAANETLQFGTAPAGSPTPIVWTFTSLLPSPSPTTTGPIWAQSTTTPNAPFVGGVVTLNFTNAQPAFANGTVIGVTDLNAGAFGATVLYGGGTNSITVQCTALYGLITGVAFRLPAYVYVDNYAALTAQVSALASVGGGQLTLPSGLYGMSVPLARNVAVSIVAQGNCIFLPVGPSATGGIIYLGGPYEDYANSSQRDMLPEVSFFPTYGICLSGTHTNPWIYPSFFVPALRSNAIGILLQGSGFPGVVEFGEIDGGLGTNTYTTYGIYTDNFTYGQQAGWQGPIRGNIIGGCDYAIYSKGYAGLTTSSTTVPAINSTVAVTCSNLAFNDGDYVLVWDPTQALGFQGKITSSSGSSPYTVQVSAYWGSPTTSGTVLASGSHVVSNGFGYSGAQYYGIDQINGNANTTYGICYDSIVCQQHVYDVRGSFGAFGANNAIQTFNGAQITFSTFTLQGYFPYSGSSTAGYADFIGIRSIFKGNQPGNSVVMLGGRASNPYIVSTGASELDIPAAATSGGGTSQTAFNNSLPIYANRWAFTCNLPSLTAGQTTDFYVWSPLCTGEQFLPQVTIQNSNGASVMVSVVEDLTNTTGVDSLTTYPTEIHIRFIALGTISANTLITCLLTVGLV